MVAAGATVTVLVAEVTVVAGMFVVAAAVAGVVAAGTDVAAAATVEFVAIPSAKATKTLKNIRSARQTIRRRTPRQRRPHLVLASGFADASTEPKKSGTARRRIRRQRLDWKRTAGVNCADSARGALRLGRAPKQASNETPAANFVVGLLLEGLLMGRWNKSPCWAFAQVAGAV